jgi:hypothetical protein
VNANVPATRGQRQTARPPFREQLAASNEKSMHSFVTVAGARITVSPFDAASCSLNGARAVCR